MVLSKNNELLYDLEDRPPANRTLIYAVQWLGFTVANTAVLPIVVGSALGLDQAGIASLAQRTFFFQALASLLQVCFGHRLPIIEGPAGMWWAVFITLGVMAPGLGKPLSLLRTDLEFGVIAAGLILVAVGLTGVIGKALKLFTPAVTGSVLVLLGLQLSGTFVRGMLGLNTGGGSIDLKSALVSLLVVTIVVVINLKARGFLQSIAILIGIAVGWVIALFVGVPSGEFIKSDALITLPELFAWGTPTFDPGVVFVSVLTGLLVLSNLVASILAMERVLDLELPRKSYNRGVAFTGFADILAGLGATVGFVPYSAGAGMVALTRVAARLPFIIFTIVLMLLGLLPQVGAFLASIPQPVGYSVLLASFCQMLGFGLKDYARMQFNARDYFVVGLPILVATGVMNLPAGSFEGIPVFAQYILGNGFVVGMLLCMLLEHVLLPKKYFS